MNESMSEPLKAQKVINLMQDLAPDKEFPAILQEVLLILRKEYENRAIELECDLKGIHMFLSDLEQINRYPDEVPVPVKSYDRGIVH